MTRTIYGSPGFIFGFLGVDLTVSFLLPRALQMSASGRLFGIVTCLWQCNVSIKRAIQSRLESKTGALFPVPS